MNRIALLALVASCSPVAAQDAPNPTTESMWGSAGWYRMEVAPGDDRCFARILVEDRNGTYNEVETLETSRGLVLVKYTTVGMHSGEPDYAEVVDLPEGVVALPSVLDLVPNEKMPICLMDGGVGM